MTLSSLLCVGVLVVALIVAGVVFVTVSGSVKTMWRAKDEEIKKLSTEELEKQVYRYETGYFQFIGEEHEPVIAFRKAIEEKDIATLHEKWGRSFSASFLALEKKAGYNDRPMLLDYYFGYEAEIKTLYDRKKAER